MKVTPAFFCGKIEEKENQTKSIAAEFPSTCIISPAAWNFKHIKTHCFSSKKYKKSTGLEIKKILRLPFGDQLEKYSRQMQMFSRQFV